MWWIVRFNRKVNVTQLNVVPAVAHIGPYWTRAEALKMLRQWSYGFSRRAT